MKLPKFQFIGFILIVFLVLVIAKISYSIGQHNASLTVKEVTPKQLAEAMQQDNFYGEYIQTMLLITGTVKAATMQNHDTIVQFIVANTPNALGAVSCNLGKNQAQVHAGNTIRVLTVAYNAQRKNGADVYMPNCYLLN